MQRKKKNIHPDLEGDRDGKKRITGCETSVQWSLLSSLVASASLFLQLRLLLLLLRHRVRFGPLTGPASPAPIIVAEVTTTPHAGKHGSKT